MSRCPLCLVGGFCDDPFPYFAQSATSDLPLFSPLERRGFCSLLRDGLVAFEDFYNNEIPEFQIIKGLQYFEDGDLYRLSAEERGVLKDKIKEYADNLKKSNI